ncbi:YihY/virulence factor BrkB family protein [Streptomyces sp. NP160]|uniref:YihY/virulence factor BrkB family protein n=1 Tax=Streptomyces sp. NP160 TaxID=2586637 RepID=UPI00111BBEF8|nr:YihY/virulence factor BrkB family protein [Streptomyces sp. NP160]TNM67857.1 YihY/virulence factor BrkB family protein [Streptomyces sp. NP160]
MGAVVGLWQRYQASHLGRALAHYGRERGQILAGGLAYVALFSLSAILVLLFTVSGSVLVANPMLLDTVVDTINGYVPNLLGDPDAGAAVDPQTLLDTNALSVTGAVTLVIALLAGTGWIDALREGVRAMFGVATDQHAIWWQKLRDLGMLLTLGLAVLSSAVASITVNAATPWLLGLVGIEQTGFTRFLVRVAGIVIVFAADWVIFVILLRLLSRLAIPWRHLRSAALLGAALFGVLKILAGTGLSFLTGTSNALLQTAGVIAGLLVWLNILFRVVLTTAAWAATDPVVVAHLTADQGEPVIGPPVGPAADAALARASLPHHIPSYGERAADRVQVAAGVVLGASVATGAALLVGGTRGVLGAVRSSLRRSSAG